MLCDCALDGRPITGLSVILPSTKNSSGWRCMETLVLGPLIIYVMYGDYLCCFSERI